MEVPVTVYAALGAVLAALIAGFFSFIGLVTSKENKISEFRLNWIDGLRDDVAKFTSATSELVRLDAHQDQVTVAEWLELGEQSYRDARESLSRIQLRLNPDHVANKPQGHDAKLMAAVINARAAFNRAAKYGASYEEAIDHIDLVRSAAAPLLKEQWERVKKGEPTYRRVRIIAWLTILLGVAFLIFGSAFQIFAHGDAANNSLKSTPLIGTAKFTNTHQTPARIYRACKLQK